MGLATGGWNRCLDKTNPARDHCATTREHKGSTFFCLVKLKGKMEWKGVTYTILTGTCPYFNSTWNVFSLWLRASSESWHQHWRPLPRPSILANHQPSIVEIGASVGRISRLSGGCQCIRISVNWPFIQRHGGSGCSKNYNWDIWQLRRHGTSWPIGKGGQFSSVFLTPRESRLPEQPQIQDCCCRNDFSN